MRKSGITSKTPNNMLLGAGVVLKNLFYIWKLAVADENENYPDGSREVVEDSTELQEGQIRLSEITNPRITYKDGRSAKLNFIKTEEGYTPKAGDHVIGVFDDGEQTVIGATSGGNKFSASVEFSDIEIDGVTVKVKGLSLKVSETASLETNLAQHTADSFKMALAGEEFKSPLDGYKIISTKPLLELSDYLDNVAYVGTMTDGTEVIIIMENPICTSGIELEGKNKETSVVKATFEPSAAFDEEMFDTLPVYVLYPEKELKGGD